MNTTRRTVLTGLASLGITTVAGSAVVGADEEGEGEAALRVAHASPDAPAVDVYLDGSPVIEGLGFRGVTDYLELPEGDYDVAVNVAGTDTTVFGPVTVALDDEDYTAVALGEVTSDDTAFTVSLFEDTNGANIGDRARVRAIHASPDAPAVDVTVADGALTLFDGVAFGGASDYAVVPAGEYDVEIRPDTADNDGPVVYEAALTLEPGATYTVFAEGYLSPDDEPADEAFGLVPTLDASAPPRGDRDADDDEDDGDEEEEYDEDDDDEGTTDDEAHGPPERAAGRGRPR